MSLRSEMLLDAKLIMRDGLVRVTPGAELDEKGYVKDWRQNLLPGIDEGRVGRDYRDKRGSELEGKFKAAHSSAALVVNSFGFFTDPAEPMPIPGFAPLQFDGFEKLFPTGLKSRMPPHLDATAHNGELLLAIESKCLEYFTPKPAEFADAYVNEIVDERRTGRWFAEMLKLRDEPRRYQYLDAAQLVKHAFGLAWTVKETPVTLLYILWEPDDERYHSMFAEHRAEVTAFADRVAGDKLAFQSMTYRELWTHWAECESGALRAHAGLLESRYCGDLGGYEGYSRVDGRKTDAGFWDDLDLD